MAGEFPLNTVVFYGLGSIGIRTLQIAMDNPRFTIVGAIDIDESKIGKDLASLVGSDKDTGIKVSSNPEKVLFQTEPHVVIHSTTSLVKDVSAELEMVASAGANCVSSCEELFFSIPENQNIFQRLNQLSREKGITILGTGVNPGFVMDVLPLFLTGICRKVERVKLERIVDASTRRLPLQRKVGMTLKPEEFDRKVGQKEIGHRGLSQSIYFLAAGLGWKLDEVQEEVKPVIALEKVTTRYFTIQKGQVTGIRNTGYGIKDGETLISLHLDMYAGASDSSDRIIIEGVPPLDVRIRGGIAGDDATASILLNSVPLVKQAPPGVVSADQLPLLHWIGKGTK